MMVEIKRTDIQQVVYQHVSQSDGDKQTNDLWERGCSLNSTIAVTVLTAFVRFSILKLIKDNPLLSRFNYHRV